MGQNMIDISDEIIDWAINKVSNNDTLASRLKKWKTTHKVWFEDVKLMSNQTKIPLGYFFLKIPPEKELDVLNFKTVGGKNLKDFSQNLADTISDMECLQEWMKDYLISQNHGKLDFVCSLKDETNIEKIADKIRERLGIKIDWYTENKNPWESFKKIRHKLENIGIITMMSGVVRQNNHKKLPIEEFRAFTLIDEYAPLIFINSNDSYGERLFSILYEAVHIWLGCYDFFNHRKIDVHWFKKEEKICYNACIEILVPNEIFIKKWLENSKEDIEDKIYDLANIFRCSNIAICRKALNNKFVDYKFFKDFIHSQLDGEENAKKASGGHYYNIIKTRIDNRLLLALDNSIKEGKTTYDDLYKFTSLKEESFKKLMEKVKEDI
ncbi:MAG: ImmA/IrrE family metallo-endopeptidase [Oscillospiraceae bacterium]|nr:ImmA/IrrE family metallo-endopeptidase [Oscillospiraceae bacterium]